MKTHCLPFPFLEVVILSACLLIINTKEIHHIFTPQFYSITNVSLVYNDLKDGFPSLLWLRIKSHGSSSPKITINVFLTNHKYQSTTLPIYIVQRNSSFEQKSLMQRNRKCHFDCRESPGGAVIGTINLCHGVRGYLETQGRSMHVFPLHNHQESFRLINSLHRLRIGPLENPFTTQHSRESFIRHAQNLHRKSILKRRKREANFQPSRIFPDRDTNIVELYMIVDEDVSLQYLSKYRSYGTLVDKIYLMISEMNMAYATFNIQFILVRLDIYEQDVVQLARKTDSFIMQSLYMLKRRSVQYVRHDCMHALVSQYYMSSVRGKAEEKTMCSATHCFGFSRDTPNAYEIETARTMIHELGHNFGLKHDTENCLCHDCLMSTGTEYNMNQFRWSTCSIHQMQDLMKFGIGRCLKDRPSNITLVPVETKRNTFQKYELPNLKKVHYCGNGIVEKGEECDCGRGSVSASQGCPEELRHCCNPHTCRLQSGAVCASGSCCDRSTCRPIETGSVCRAKVTECDLPEYCNGTSEWCPDDRRKADGIQCITETNEKAQCFNGHCATRNSWCQVLWGSTAKPSHATCFKENLTPVKDTFKNCGTIGPDSFGHSATQWTVRQCRTEQDQYCGRLWCSHLNEKLNIQGHFEETVMSDQYGYDCHAVFFDTYWNISDPGMVPNGAPCGDNKMCYRGRCIPVKLFVPENKTCDCNGRGVCNDQGNCHCDQWFLPPHCEEIGNGGSVDSGPPPEGWYEKMIFRILMTVFLFVLPLMSFLLFLVIYSHLYPDRFTTIFGRIFACKLSLCRVCPRLSPPNTKAAKQSPSKSSNPVMEEEELTVSTPLTSIINNPPPERIYKSNGYKAVPKKKHPRMNGNPVKSNRSEPDLIKEAAPKRLQISGPYASQTSLDLTSGFFDLKHQDDDSPISSSIFKELCSQGIVDSEYSRDLIHPKHPNPNDNQTSQSLHSIVQAAEEEPSHFSSQPGKFKLPLRSASVRNDIKSIGNKIKQPMSNLVDKARVSQPKPLPEPPAPIVKPQISLPHLQETSCTVKTQDLPDSNYKLIKNIKPTRPGTLQDAQKAASKPEVKTKPQRPANKPSLPPRLALQKVHLPSSSGVEGSGGDISPTSTYV